MPDDTLHPFSLPADLQARLDAAGVTDQASLEAALQSDPTLVADLEAFAAANSEALAAANMMALLNPFAAVADDEQMLEFWRSVPAELEEPLIEVVAALITQAEAEGNDETVAQLRPRLEGFRQIHQAARGQQAGIG